jgi:hypothetical protein
MVPAFTNYILFLYNFFTICNLPQNYLSPSYSFLRFYLQKRVKIIEVFILLSFFWWIDDNHFSLIKYLFLLFFFLFLQLRNYLYIFCYYFLTSRWWISVLRNYLLKLFIVIFHFFILFVNYSWLFFYSFWVCHYLLVLWVTVVMDRYKILLQF